MRTSIIGLLVPIAAICGAVFLVNTSLFNIASWLP